MAPPLSDANEGLWPASQIDHWPVAKLVPYARNSRLHSPLQVDQIAASIREWGWTSPVLVDESGMIIAGHARVLAAQNLKIAEIPVMVARGWSDTKKRAYVIADNKLAMNSTFDTDLLIQELGDIMSDEFPLDLIGFSNEELSFLLDGAAPGEGLCDADDVPSVPVTPVSEPGDTWILGSHRLQVGDFSDLNAVEKALNGVKPHLMVTDVYQAPKQMSGRPKFQAASAPDWREAFALFPGDVAYVWHDDLQAANVAQNLTDCGFGIRSQIIWVRPHFMTGRGDYQKQHEPAFYAVKASAKGHWTGGRTQSTIWQFPDNTNGQTASKPVECMKRPIENNSSPGQAVYDPCAGKGSVIIACEIAGRVCHALEADSKLADVALKRFAQFTGKQPVLESTGKTYDDMAAERTPKT